MVRLRVIYRVYEHEGALDGPDVFAHSLPVVACSFEAQGLSLDVLLLAVVAGNSEGASVVELDLRYCTAASALLASHEPDFTFLPENAGKLERTSENHDIIEWINKPQDLRAYRQTIMVPHWPRESRRLFLWVQTGSCEANCSTQCATGHSDRACNTSL